MQKVHIKLNILLPGIPHEHDACVDRIIAVLQQQKGIEKVHLTGGKMLEEARLCFHYDPDILSLSAVEAIARKEGAGITGRYGHILIESAGIRDMQQAALLEKELRSLAGILTVSVSAVGPVSLEYDSEKISATTINRIIGGHHEEKGAAAYKHPHQEKQEQDHGNDHHHEHNPHQDKLRQYAPVAISLLMLLSGIVADNFIRPDFFEGGLRLAWYSMAYLPAGLPVVLQGIRLFLKGEFFTEFVLMTIATLGAFVIGEYPEGVAVMVFYTIGELFQDAAVSRAKRSIKALLDIRPDTASVQRNGGFEAVAPSEVPIGAIIQVRAGEKVPLDGELLTAEGSFNTAALTGESQPATIREGATVLAGMINRGKVVELKVSRLYNDSSLARILTLVQEATTRKAKTEQFIRRFSRVYTPVVVLLAVGIAAAPYFFVQQYIFSQWLYRALIFLVISCPCALVISIPLGYFGGIGAASRKGILFKGSNFLDLVTKVNTVMMDKTGTLTKGVFTVQEVKSQGMETTEWLPMAAALEAASTHPVAQAIVAYAGSGAQGITVAALEETSGQGIQGIINGKKVAAGNLKLMNKMGIKVPESIMSISDTIVLVSVGEQLAGYILIADEIKEDSKAAVTALQECGITTIMLSGDKQSVVDRVARTLGIDKAFGDLLPEDKVKKVSAVKEDPAKIVAFVGDGINDAPVLALSDVGIAMGGLGSDAAIETADIIIQTDQPSRIVQAIRIGKATNRVVWQNIIFAFAVKGIVLILGAGGLATMWEAVFADVGVALLAILNAMRIQKMTFRTN